MNNTVTPRPKSERSWWDRFVHTRVGAKYDLASWTKAALITAATLIAQYFVVMAAGVGAVPALIFQLARVSEVTPNTDPTWFLMLAWYAPALFIGGFLFVAVYKSLAYLWRLRTRFIEAVLRRQVLREEQEAAFTEVGDDEGTGAREASE